MTTWALIFSAHVVIRLINALSPRVFFVLSLLSLVVDAVERVDVLLDGVPGSAPHLVDEVEDHEEEQEEDTRTGGKPDDHTEQGVVLLA